MKCSEIRGIFKLILSNQRYRIFFFRGHGRWSFIHSNPKIVFFFFSRSGKKKIQTCFFLFPRKSWSVIHSDFYGVPFFLTVVGCIFFSAVLSVFCVFFSFHGKVHMSFIHSISELFFFFPASEKIKNSIFIHSIDFSPKVHKNELFRGKKKYGTFADAIIMYWYPT